MGDISAHFSRHEFACQCGCGFDCVDHVLILELEIIWREFYVPSDRFKYGIQITSGCRCDEHNKDVGGASNSYHTRGRAADFKVWLDWEKRQLNSEIVANFIRNRNKERFGVGRYINRTHIDSGTIRDWSV